MLICSKQNYPHQILLNRGSVCLFQTHIYANLNEEVKVRKWYSCLKKIIQAQLHVGFFTVFFIKRASLK